MIKFINWTLTWWNGSTIGTRIYTWRNGQFVGEDIFGNRYFRDKTGRRRWVLYKTIAEPSQVPADKGTCTDEVVRAYRLVGVDLQQVVHEDMLRNFAAYPTKFHLTAPDPNIDHRRVWNLLAFFNRNAESLPVTEISKDYKPGDVIIWDLDNFQLHIGLVTRKWSKKHARPLIMHNISSGPHVEDKLFEYKIIGHYRYEGGLKPDPTPAAQEV